MGHEDCADTCASVVDYYDLDYSTFCENPDCLTYLQDNFCDFNRIFSFNKTDEKNMSIKKENNGFDPNFEILKTVSFDVSDVSHVRNDLSLTNDDKECENALSICNLYKHNSHLENSNNFKLACLNVRSLYPKLEEVISLVTTNDYSIFAINESWLDESLCDNDTKIPNYDVIRRDRNRQGGGVCVYILSQI